MRRLILIFVLISSFGTSMGGGVPETLEEVIKLGLTVIEINTVDSVEPTCDYVDHPEGCVGRSITNATQVPGAMNIYHDGIKVYESGDYVNKSSGMTIKIRGNGSAYFPQKSFKIKLQQKADLLCRGDERYDDKDWILLAKSYNLKTAVGFKVNELVHMQWTPGFEFVNLIVNGVYRGVYLLCESVKRNKDCRINVDKDNGYLFEYDAYWWNEDFAIHVPSSYCYGYTFKYPDPEDITEEQVAYMTDFLYSFDQSFNNGTYVDYIDANSFASWTLAHDILGTSDPGGSNMFLTKYDETDTSKVKMANLWDFDSVFGTPDNYCYIHRGYAFYINSLFNSENPAFKNAYRAKWDKFIEEKAFDTLLDYIRMYNEGEFANSLDLSWQLDAERWGDHTYKSVSACVEETLSWFSNRKAWLGDNIPSDYPHNESAAIENVCDDESSNSTYYELTGRVVTHPVNGRPYIKTNADKKTFKVIGRGK